MIRIFKFQFQIVKSFSAFANKRSGPNKSCGTNFEKARPKKSSGRKFEKARPVHGQSETFRKTISCSARFPICLFIRQDNDRIEAARVEGKTIYTSDIADLDKVRLITKEELKANTFPHSWTNEKDKGKGVQWLRDHLRGTKAGSQGFVIMKGDAFESERDFVGLLDKREYKNKFYGIFQKLQVAQGKGDKKRWQVKMGDVFNVAAQNVRDAQVLFEEENIDDDMKKDRMRFLQEKNSEFDVVSRMINHQLKVYDIIYKVSRTNHI